MFSKISILAAMAISMTVAAGCSVTTQVPVKEVAYDFSDHDFYDRSYAPSPAYGDIAAPTADHAKAKHADDDDSDDDQQVVVVVGHGGKVTVDQGAHHHKTNRDDDDDSAGDTAPRPRQAAQQPVVISGNAQIPPQVQAQAPIAPQPMPQAAQMQPVPQAPRAQHFAPAQPAPAANPGFSRN